MKKRKLVAFALAGSVLIGGGIETAHAASKTIKRNVASYSTTVGRYNGDGYTGTLKKITSNEAAIVNSTTVGGDHEVDVRIEKSNGEQPSGWRRIGDSDRVSISNTLGAGLYPRLHFSNDLFTSVNVQVNGSWSPDTKDRVEK